MTPTTPTDAQMKLADVTAWLIERDDLAGGLHYFANCDQDHWWTTDPNKAERFADKERAQMCCKGGDKDGPLRVCQHKWIDQ